jgi:hypothetical protein
MRAALLRLPARGNRYCGPVPNGPKPVHPNIISHIVRNPIIQPIIPIAFLQSRDSLYFTQTDRSFRMTCPRVFFRPCGARFRGRTITTGSRPWLLSCRPGRGCFPDKIAMVEPRTGQFEIVRNPIIQPIIPIPFLQSKDSLYFAAAHRGAALELNRKPSGRDRFRVNRQAGRCPRLLALCAPHA